MFDSNLRTLLKDLFCFLVSKISGRKLNETGEPWAVGLAKKENFKG